MTCPRCQQPVSHEVGNRLYGTVLSRCGCGVKPMEPDPLAPIIPNSLAHLPDDEDLAPPRERGKGYTIAGTFYGTCTVCKDPFEAKHQKKTCGKTECRQHVLRVGDPMIPKQCPTCPTVFQTRKAKPRKTCLPCHRKTLKRRAA